MKKLTILMVLVFIGLLTFGQEKKNGTVYIEHPVFQKVNAFWAALTSDNKDAMSNLIADSVMVSLNGNHQKNTKAEFLKGLDWWNKEFENLKVVADTPAYADAIDYKKGGLWVQDWLRIQGTDKETGINLDLPMHNLYSFNKAGKISSMHHYFNNDVFEEIQESKLTRENGEVYIDHPYIIKARKLVNAFCAKDLEAMLPFYDPKVSFSNLTMKMGQSNNLEAQKKEWQMIWDNNDNIKMKQVGYPDCIYYAKNGVYTVYSWWVFTADAKDGTKVKMPMLLTQTFNDDGLIVRSMGYYSSNHYEHPVGKMAKK
ncbi:MAG TPA: hypothetical protein VKA27_11880 [Sunxiuqinia sp.]|nr:hypothetical protein [Sunxiuqinia sp.]